MLTLERVATILADHWGRTGELTSLDGERDQNTRVVTNDGTYVLKIASPSEHRAVADFQSAALAHIARTAPEIGLPHVVATDAGPLVADVDIDGATTAARLLTFVPGITFDDAGAMPPDALERVGRFQGRLARALADFEHPAATTFMAWAADGGMIGNDELWDGLGRDSCAAVEPFRERATAAASALARLRRQVVHNDGHRGNLLRSDARSLEVTGVIDFGDLVETAVVADLAVCAASFAEGHPDVPGALCALVGGYHREVGLDADEVAVLPDLLLARRVLGVLLVEYQARHAPPDRLDEIAGELPELRAGAIEWGHLDNAATVDSLTKHLARIDRDDRGPTSNQEWNDERR